MKWAYRAPLSATWVSLGGAGSITAPSNCCFNTVDVWNIRTVVQNGNCHAANTTAITVTVVATPTVTMSGVSTVCTGGLTTLTATTSGGLTTPNYQWRQNNSGTWTNVGTNSNTFTTSTLTANKDYRVIVTETGNGCNHSNTNFTVNVVAIPTVNVTNAVSIICVGGSIVLNANMTDASGSCTIQWQKSPYKVTWSDISDATGLTLTTSALNRATHYKVRLICSGNGCCN